ncbi:MAG: hypothetical protein ACXVJD_16110 [Mucilaginibacter sp.]
MPLGNKQYEDVEVAAFSSHSAADVAFNELAENLSFTRDDPGYKNSVTPFLSTLERSYPGQYDDHIVKTKKLVEEFMGTWMNKETFKDKWRAIQPGTDEHFSTEGVFTVLDTLRRKSTGVDMAVVKDVFTVVSLFRMPTEQTGHASLKPGGGPGEVEHVMAHPRGNKQSLYIDTGRNPKHWTFDMVRRTYSLLEGKAQSSRNAADGTGVILAVLGDSVRTTMHNVGSAYAKDVQLSTRIAPDVKEEAFVNREQIKKLYNHLFGITDPGTQAKDNMQYHGLSPAARTFEPGADGNLHTRSLSPMRVAYLAPGSSPAAGNTQISGNKRTRSPSTLRGTRMEADPSSGATSGLKRGKF